MPSQTIEDLRYEYEVLRDDHEKLKMRHAELLGGGEAQPALVQLRDQLAHRESEISSLRTELASRTVTSPAVLSFPESVTAIEGVAIGESGQIVLPGLLFASGSASLTAKGRSVLDRLAGVFASELGGETFHIVGHTDDTALSATRNRYEYNIKLGFERAFVVFKYMNVEHKIAESQFRLHSYGFAEPRVKEDSDDARSQNRRVEIYRSGQSF